MFTAVMPLFLANVLLAVLEYVNVTDIYLLNEHIRLQCWQRLS